MIRVPIAGCYIGDGQPCFIIAEAGSNHNGNFEQAKRLIDIAAEAGAHIGVGHLMRCLALAQAWRAKGGCAVFLSHCESDALVQRIKVPGIGYIPLDKPHPAPTDLRQTLNCLREHHADWLVLDGYHFDPDYQQVVQSAGVLV